MPRVKTENKLRKYINNNRDELRSSDDYRDKGKKTGFDIASSILSDSIKKDVFDKEYFLKELDSQIDRYKYMFSAGSFSSDKQYSYGTLEAFNELKDIV